MQLLFLAGVVATYIVPKAPGKIGEKVGESALAKSGELIQATRKVGKEKLEASKTDGVLAIAQTDPTTTNLKMLETILVSQMDTDSDFATHLQELVDRIQAKSPSLQIVLDTVRIRGNVELGNIDQVSEARSAEQVIGRNLGVGGDLKIGGITQKIQGEQ